MQAVQFPEPRDSPCDYCQGGTPRWIYPCGDAHLGTITHGQTVLHAVSLGNWSACETCSVLIEADDWPALARRTLAAVGLKRVAPGTRVRLLAQIRLTHRQFRRARSGPRVSVGGHAT